LKLIDERGTLSKILAVKFFLSYGEVVPFISKSFGNFVLLGKFFTVILDVKRFWNLGVGL
jgi:hypothetical protein